MRWTCTDMIADDLWGSWNYQRPAPPQTPFQEPWPSLLAPKFSFIWKKHTLEPSLKCKWPLGRLKRLTRRCQRVFSAQQPKLAYEVLMVAVGRLHTGSKFGKRMYWAESAKGWLYAVLTRILWIKCYQHPHFILLFIIIIYNIYFYIIY